MAVTGRNESRRSPSAGGYFPRSSEEGVNGCLLSSGSGVRSSPGAPDLVNQGKRLAFPLEDTVSPPRLFRVRIHLLVDTSYTLWRIANPHCSRLNIGYRPCLPTHN